MGLKHLAISLVLLGAVLVMPGVAAEVSCASVLSRYGQEGHGDPEVLRALFLEARDQSDCGADALSRLEDAVADAFAARAERRITTGADLEEIEHDLRQSLVFRKDWRIYERLGDVATGFDDYVTASLGYMYAVHTMGNVEATVVAPPQEAIERLLRKFALVWTVADFYARPLPILFGGSWARAWHRELVWATALGVDALRGFKVPEPLLPVTFKFASSELTRHGEETLVVMSQMLGRLGSPDIRLAGRAGAHELEDDKAIDLERLATERAETVQAWFEARNYRGRVLIEDGLSAEVTSLVAGLSLPERVAHAFERRVDYVWEGGPQLPGGALSR